MPDDGNATPPSTGHTTDTALWGEVSSRLTDVVHLIEQHPGGPNGDLDSILSYVLGTARYALAAGAEALAL